MTDRAIKMIRGVANVKQYITDPDESLMTDFDYLKPGIQKLALEKYGCVTTTYYKRMKPFIAFEKTKRHISGDVFIEAANNDDYDRVNDLVREYSTKYPLSYC